MIVPFSVENTNLKLEKMKAKKCRLKQGLRGKLMWAIKLCFGLVNGVVATNTADQMSYPAASMIVFDYNVNCPTLILAAILGEVVQFAMCVHICIHNRRISFFLSV